METTVLYNPVYTQIINGEEVMSPSPKLAHQVIQARLAWKLMQYIHDNDLGEIFFSPLDTILEDNFNVLQPDILFVSKRQEHIMQDWIRGAPEMVVEIISKSSRNMDTVVKKEIYERYGVKEYWIVFPDKTSIEVYTLQSGQYQLLGNFTGDQLVQTPVFPGLDFKAEAIFPFLNK
ncbi:Uma2 family endonuclease [Dyadobacter aurulentus]|uniref:Uma2 family endonuclease n=1 Tax=Dyadobacter sp. UC 10 TaxID=2605428 RepID=UPI0011F1A7C3|nr:Uma2 family endonuclease [Dyadobacter sp. UC 10]KAA0989355.1 Uma2 family endonuclease [Dyadobacter sp. UC 10]